jgi:predicted dithiol-disulfide oxidoreductase (DUF899 family)
MITHQIASRSDWLAARKQLLDDEKKFTLLRDQLSEKRRALPWVKIEENYVFEGPDGPVTLADLFAGRSQLIVYHFMFAPEWEAGCKSCSFWADNFNGVTDHLTQRDTSFAAISRAPVSKLLAHRKRLGWSFTWVSSQNNRFNYDFGVAFTPDELAKGASYNYGSFQPKATDMPGVSVFIKEGDSIFHTYSTFGRGIDLMNTAYNYLDLVPKGRDEASLEFSMAWLDYHDKYPPAVAD